MTLSASVFFGGSPVAFCVQPRDEFLPPISGSIFEQIEKARRPFLIADRKGYQSARRLIHDKAFRKRGREFVQRLEEYWQPDSPWFLGDGPFSGAVDFSPLKLDDDNSQVYLKILIEMLAYIGIEQERDAINRAIDEFHRQLEWIDPQTHLSGSPPQQQAFTKRQASLFAGTVLLFDTVYFRLDASDRHGPNNRIKAMRDRMAAFCAALDLDAIPPDEALIYSSALGLSTLHCISAHPNEWSRMRTVPIQSWLPDLYLAARMTRQSMRRLIGEDARFLAPLNDAESALQLALPWIECMKRLGYPHIVPVGAYSKIGYALESHRIPETSLVVQPNRTEPMTTPWIPAALPLFAFADPDMYEDLSASETEPFAEEDEDISEDRFDETPASPLGQTAQNFRNQTRQNVQGEQDGRPRSLRQILNEGFPRQAEPKPMPTVAAVMESTSAWTRPPKLYLPTIWGTVYQLSAQESPDERFQDLWLDFTSKIDSHPYHFIFFKPFKQAKRNDPQTRSFVRYPDQRFSLYSEKTPYGDYLIGTQSSAATVLHSTFAVANESVLLSENGTEWRWHHEKPISAYAGNATSPVFIIQSTPPIQLGATTIAATSAINNGYVSDASSHLSTSLFSYWSTNPPSGKTHFVRKHLGGLGSAYTIVAHFPEVGSATSDQFRYVNFQMRQNDKTNSDEDVPGLLRIFPEESMDILEPDSLEDWQRMRYAERAGTIPMKTYGILNILFSPETLYKAGDSEGVLGRFLEAELAVSPEPYFYTAIIDQPGREMFEVKYPTLPMPGMRVLEWRQGLEIIAVKQGNGIQNEFVQSDADLALISRDAKMNAIFYLMVNGTKLQVKFSPRQRSWETLASVKGPPITAAWSSRRIETNIEPKAGSAFYAPKILGFKLGEQNIPFGQKGDQAVVHSNRR